MGGIAPRVPRRGEAVVVDARDPRDLADRCDLGETRGVENGSSPGSALHSLAFPFRERDPESEGRNRTLYSGALFTGNDR